MTDPLATLTTEQDRRNADLLAATVYCGPRFESKVLPFTLDLPNRRITAGDLAFAVAIPDGTRRSAQNSRP